MSRLRHQLTPEQQTAAAIVAIEAGVAVAMQAATPERVAAALMSLAVKTGCKAMEPPEVARMMAETLVAAGVIEREGNADGG